MKISKDIVINLVKEVRANTEETAVETNEGMLAVYYLDDITLTFSTGEKPSFYGLVFEALGRDFTVLSDLEFLVSMENEEGEDDAYQIEDKDFIGQLESFLVWRTETLSKFKV